MVPYSSTTYYYDCCVPGLRLVGQTYQTDTELTTHEQLSQVSAALGSRHRPLVASSTTVGNIHLTADVLISMESQTKKAQLEAAIVEGCDNLTWSVTGIFVLSIFLTILRPDPTLAICLFAFYGTKRKDSK